MISPISVKDAAACQVFVDVPHYRASIWGPIVWKMQSQLTDKKFLQLNTSKVMNYHEHFHPLKNCGVFPTIFTKKLSDLLHSK